METQILIMLGLMVVAMVAFVREFFPIEVTALALLTFLVVSGILDVDEALSGFSSTAAVAIGCLFVLSHALTKTGLLETVAARAGDKSRDRPWPMIVLLLVLVCVGSAVLNNTAVVALTIPLAMRLCHDTGLSPSRVLLPLSFASILGGTLTLVGTSTNLLVDSVVRTAGQPGLGLFEFTLLGAIIAAAGLLYMGLSARRLLSDRANPDALTRKYRITEFLSELVVGPESALIGTDLDHEQINVRFAVTVLEVIRSDDEVYLETAGTVALREGDLLVVQGEMDDILRMKRELALTLTPEITLDDAQLLAGGRLIEAWVTPGSQMIGRTLKELAFHQQFGAYVLAIGRVRRTVRRRVADSKLRFGDALLVLAPEGAERRLEANGDVVVLTEHETRLRKKRLWWLPLAVLPASILAAAVGWLDIAASALAGVSILLLFRVITPQEAYRAVDWPVIFVIAAFVPLGIAFQSTGTADFLAGSIQAMSGWAPENLRPHVALAMITLVTSVLTQIASNSAAAVVVTPIALSLGPALGIDARPLVIAVCFAASAAFLTPMGYQTNLMVHAAGQYRFGDYFRFGAPLALMGWLLTVLLVPVIWPF